MSSKPVVIKFACDSKEARTNHVRSKLSAILKVYLEIMFPEYYPDNQNIGPYKYRFRLSIFQINYSIEDINYRLSHGLTLYGLWQNVLCQNVLWQHLLWQNVQGGPVILLIMFGP
jgi:hypothetical protein